MLDMHSLNTPVTAYTLYLSKLVQQVQQLSHNNDWG